MPVARNIGDTTGLMSAADAACLAAKELGRDRVLGGGMGASSQTTQFVVIENRPNGLNRWIGRVQNSQVETIMKWRGLAVSRRVSPDT